MVEVVLVCLFKWQPKIISAGLHISSIYLYSIEILHFVCGNIVRWNNELWDRILFNIFISHNRKWNVVLPEQYKMLVEFQEINISLGLCGL